MNASRIKQPMHNRVLVRRYPRPTEAGGLFLPEHHKGDWPLEATVLMVGPACTDVQPGDHVWIERHAGAEIGDEHTDWIALPRESEITLREIG